MKPAVKLPPEMLQKTIGTMFPGETLYTVPWAMEIDSERRCWINTTFAAMEEPGGTVRMEITRTPDGYHVRIPADERYLYNSKPSTAAPYAPVIEVVVG